MLETTLVYILLALLFVYMALVALQSSKTSHLNDPTTVERSHCTEPNCKTFSDVKRDKTSYLFQLLSRRTEAEVKESTAIAVLPMRSVKAFDAPYSFGHVIFMTY